MAGYNFGPPPKTNHLNFEKFKGVDFQTNPLEMDYGRSPNSRNMYIDKSGYPVKRSGWQLYKAVPDGQRVNGIFKIQNKYGKRMVVHAGNTLYEYAYDEVELVQIGSFNLADNRSTAFHRDGKLFILDGQKIIVLSITEDDNITGEFLRDIGFIPTTTISRNPDGTGGNSLQAVNMVTPKRTNTFLGKASIVDYIVDQKKLDADLIKAKKMTAAGVWVDLVETTDFTVDRVNGKITFTVAPGASPVTGMDNVEITFSKTNQMYEDRVNKCTIFDIFTIGSGDYFFLSGNKESKNQDYRSFVNDPTYFPDTGYSIVGQDNAAIMTYAKLNNAQVIIKEDNGQDVTIYIRSSAQDGGGKTVFPIVSGVVSSGCVSSYATVNLRDDKLFLSQDGVSSIVTTILGVNMTQGRSYYIDPMLLKSNMNNAVAIEFQGKYMLAVDNDKVFIADSRLKEYNKYAGNESFQYEWSVWDNMPVRVWYKEDDTLYFGTQDGRIMVMSVDDGQNFTSYYKDIDQPVRCYWDTPYIDFGTISRYKNLKGLWIVLQPNIRTSCQIFYKTKETIQLSPTANPIMIINSDTAFADMFDFGSIDFTRFSFLTNDGPHVFSTNRKEKKFNLMQLRFANEEAEPLGIYKVQMEYTISSKYKSK